MDFYEVNEIYELRLLFELLVVERVVVKGDVDYYCWVEEVWIVLIAQRIALLSAYVGFY